MVLDCCSLIPTNAALLPLQAMKSLEEVHMPQNGINHKGITALADAFKVNSKLRHLNLSDNTFTERGSISMAQVSSKQAVGPKLVSGFRIGVQ